MSNTQTFTILLGGNLTVTPRLKAQTAGSRFIAADSGMGHALKFDVIPELWVGDFDSSDAALQDTFKLVPRESYPAAKATTDGAIAIEAALSRGAKRLILVGASGGRFDHALSHGLQLIALANQGFEAFASSGDEEIYPLIHQLSVHGLHKGARVSVLGLGELEGLLIHGVRWPLQGRHIEFASTLTISNEAQGPVSISLESGMALVTVHPLADAKA